MGLKDILGNPIINPIGIIDDGPSFIDKVNMLFTDVETEGKKQGYSKAAAEYEKVYQNLVIEYRKTKELIDSQKNMYDKQSDVLINTLEMLENQKRNLENQVMQKSKAVSEKYDIPISEVQGSLTAGTGMACAMMFDLLGIIYHHKERKLREAEQRGYLEAKEIYETKVDKLKKDLASLKSKGDSDIRELVNMINDIFGEIAEKQMEIVELTMLL